MSSRPGGGCFGRVLGGNVGVGVGEQGPVDDVGESAFEAVPDPAEAVAGMVWDSHSRLSQGTAPLAVELLAFTPV